MLFAVECAARKGMLFMFSPVLRLEPRTVMLQASTVLLLLSLVRRHSVVAYSRNRLELQKITPACVRQARTSGDAQRVRDCKASVTRRVHATTIEARAGGLRCIEPFAGAVAGARERASEERFVWPTRRVRLLRLGMMKRSSGSMREDAATKEIFWASIP